MNELVKFLGERYVDDIAPAVDDFKGSEDAKILDAELWAWIHTKPKRTSVVGMQTKLFAALNSGSLPESKKVLQNLSAYIAISKQMVNANRKCDPLTAFAKNVVDMMMAIDDRILAAKMFLDACGAARAAVRVFYKTSVALVKAINMILDDAEHDFSIADILVDELKS